MTQLSLLKLCTKCGMEKGLEAFYLRTKTKKGRSYSYRATPCMECQRAATAARRTASEEAKQRARDAVRAWKKANPGWRRESLKRKAEREGRTYVPREMSNAEAKRFAEKKRADRAAERDRERAAKLQAKPWLDPSLSHAESRRLRYQVDPDYNVRERVRAAMRRKEARRASRLAKSIRAAVAQQSRSPSAEKIIGYPIRLLVQHLERLFTDGMTWARFCKGEIHIDHIRPLCSFDLNDDHQLREAWALSNLRPLWAADNLRKGRTTDRLQKRGSLLATPCTGSSGPVTSLVQGPLRGAYPR